jgi:putative transposase
MTEYSKGSHPVFHHRYHLVWITKYGYPLKAGQYKSFTPSLIKPKER